MISNLKKIHCLFIVVVFISISIFLWKTLENSEEINKERWKLQEQKKAEENLEYLKIFHLDLKGGPPKLNYLLNVMPLIKQAGANAILIEYEDMFPFSGSLKNISAGNAYTVQQLMNLMAFLKKLHMEVIPLVQTFGHLEYVLKLEEFQDLREMENFPLEICPSKKKAIALIKEMITQVMALHPDSKYIHIGCDEVRHLGTCAICSRFNPRKLFARHVMRISSFVKSNYPNVTSLIWDDMLRGWTYVDLKNSGLGSAVQPVVWVYGKNVRTIVTNFLWAIYAKVFDKLWIASAFKGAFGEREVLPNLYRHLENNLSWMNFSLQMKQEIGISPKIISGIFITGWSRYDHFALLCELLPTGIPSLILNLVFLNFKTKNPVGLAKWLTLLKCPDYFIEINAFISKKEELFRYQLGDCDFPGNDLYSLVVSFVNFQTKVQEMEEKIRNSAWVSDYNIKKNFTNVWRVLEMFPKEGFAGEVLRDELQHWKTLFISVMSQYFDAHTVSEWEEQYIKPIENKLENIEKKFQVLISRNTWPKRPLS